MQANEKNRTEQCSPEENLGPLGRRVRLGWGALNAVALVGLFLFLCLPSLALHWAWLLVPLAVFNIYDGYRAWRCGVCRLRRMGINTPL